MKSELLSKLGDTMKIESLGCGLSIVINPKVDMDIEKLKSLAIKEKIKIYFAKDVSGGDWDAIRMGFGGFKENEIKDAINAFSKIWFQALVG
jgi:GntR family transcriptional regulator/MocR family aminotransferase